MGAAAARRSRYGVAGVTRYNRDVICLGWMPSREARMYLETSEGATLGKKVLNLRVADRNDRSPIDTDASVRRNWWMLLGVVSGIPVIGWLASLASLGIAIAIGVTISSDTYNQGWHDKMASTTVPRAA